MVIRNHTSHAVTYESLWTGDTRWATVTLQPGQRQVREHVGMVVPLEVLYETPTHHGPRNRLALLMPFNVQEPPLAHNFHGGPGGKVTLG